jgi:hypothetical protein
MEKRSAVITLAYFETQSVTNEIFLTLAPFAKVIKLFLRQGFVCIRQAFSTKATF